MKPEFSSDPELVNRISASFILMKEAIQLAPSPAGYLSFLCPLILMSFQLLEHEERRTLVEWVVKCYNETLGERFEDGEDFIDWIQERRKEDGF